jgi:hypothetical protein
VNSATGGPLTLTIPIGENPVAYYVSDRESIRVGNRLLPGKHATLPLVADRWGCDAQWVSWESRVSICGFLSLPFGLTLLWGDAVKGDPFETTVLARAGWFRLDRRLPEAELQALEEAYAAEAERDAWLEQRAEQGWYDL